jgi:ribose 5-phosphate isomerase RpiB
MLTVREAAAAVRELREQLGVDAELAADIVDGVRTGLVEAFESARNAVARSNKRVVGVTDSLLNGLRRLPLVAAH